jgi:hypothetical protein
MHLLGVFLRRDIKVRSKTYARRLRTRKLQFAEGQIVRDSASIAISTREPACGCGVESWLK